VQALTANRRTGLIIFLLIAGIVALYWPLWNAHFLSVDDPGYVVDNPHVSTGLSRSNVTWAFTRASQSNYHPLTWLSLMMDCQLFGVTPRPMHLENLLFHILNTILVFWVFWKMTGRQGCAAFVAGLFAVHPLHVESVAWVAERKDVLSAFFWLLTMLAYAWYVKRKDWLSYLSVAGLFLLALMAKPVAVTLPCALLLLDIWPLGRMPWLGSGRSHLPGKSQWLPLVREKVPLFALSGAWCAVTFIVQSRGGAVIPVAGMPLGMRISNAIVSYVRYARKFFWPSDLSAFYPFSHPWSLMLVLGAAILLAGITTLTVLNFRRRPYLLFGWLWFMGTLVPMIGLVQVGNASLADRYMYIPMIGLAVIVAWGGAEIIAQWRRQKWLLPVGACAAIVGLALVTINDVPWWRESEGLYTRAIARSGPSVFSSYAIGTSMMRRKEYTGAAKEFAECVQLQPTNPNVHRALGAAYRELKQYDLSQREIAAAIQIDPEDASTWSALGLIDVDRKNWAQAAARFGKATSLAPSDPGNWTNLAIAHHALHQPAKALSDLDHAIALDSGLPKAWYMRGSLLLETGRAQEATKSFARAAAIEPHNGEVRYRLGLALMESGHGRQAVDPLLAAVRLRPNDPEPLAHLAWVLATYPDKHLRRADDAMFLASRAAELTEDKSADALDVLAAAQAEKRDFAHAAETADRAEKIARDQGNAELADQIAARAAIYRSGQPVRDSSLAGADGSELLP
jgi:tetratricopeptide (TPR) repeat protein